MFRITYNLPRLLAVALILPTSIVYSLEVDPKTRQHSANDPLDWSGAVTVRPGPNENNWTAKTIPIQPGGVAAWLNITPVPPSFLAYAMNENFNAEERSAYIEFTGGTRFTVVQSGRGSVLSRNAFTFENDGGTDQLSVSVLPGTAWSVSSTVSWVRILTGTKGFGNDTVRFAVDPNDGIQPREGTFVVGGNVVRISQTGIDLTIEPSQAVVLDKLSIVSFNVTALLSQSWKPVSTTSWISITDPGPGRGNGTVVLSVLPNDNYEPRQGVVAVGSRTFQVNQAGNQNPTLSILPTSATGGDQGAQGRINVIVTPGMPWSAKSDSSWLQIVAGEKGVGNGEIAFVVSPNLTLGPRNATITVSLWEPRLGQLPLVGLIRDDENGIDLVSGRQWTRLSSEFMGVGGQFTYNEASVDAIKRGGQLAWPSNQDELDWIVKHNSGWLDIHWAGSGAWIIGSGSVATVDLRLPWAPGEPSAYDKAYASPARLGQALYSASQFTRRGYVLKRGTRTVALWHNFAGQTTIACRFKGSTQEPQSLIAGFSPDVLLFQESAGSQLRIGDFTWPLSTPLGNKEHVAVLVVEDNTRVRVYLDGIMLFSRAIGILLSGDFRSAMNPRGEVRIYGRALTPQEVAIMSQELSGRIHFTLSQAAPLPVLTKTGDKTSAAGGTLQTELTLPAGVPWTASTSTSWLKFVTGTNQRTDSTGGIGPQVVSVFVDQNNTTEERRASVTIAGLKFSVIQTGRSVTLKPLSSGTGFYGDNVNAIARETGGVVLVGIFPEAGAAWTLHYANESDKSWIVPTPVTGGGNKDILFAISPYNSPLSSRTAVFRVADKEIRITQQGYTATVTPSTTSFPEIGGEGRIQVSVPASAFWETVALSPWITIVTGQNANGSGSVLFKVASNTGPARFGTIVVAGEPIQLSQAAAIVGQNPPRRGPYTGARKVEVDLRSKNVERGLAQIESGDGATRSTNAGGSECRVSVTTQNPGKYIYFRIDESFKWAELMAVTVEVEYFDVGGDDFRLQFDGSDLSAPFQGAYSFSRETASLFGASVWKVAKFKCTGAKFRDSQNSQSDFRIVVPAAGLFVRSVRVIRTEVPELSIMPALIQNPFSLKARLTGNLGSRYSVERSTDLIRWEEAAVLPPLASEDLEINLISPTKEQGFYRIRLMQ